MVGRLIREVVLRSGLCQVFVATLAFQMGACSPLCSELIGPVSRALPSFDFRHQSKHLIPIFLSGLPNRSPTSDWLSCLQTRHLEAGG